MIRGLCRHRLPFAVRLADRSGAGNRGQDMTGRVLRLGMQTWVRYESKMFRRKGKRLLDADEAPFRDENGILQFDD